MDHGETDEGDSGSRVALEVFGETPTAADPGEGALDDPALGQQLEASGIRSLHDLQLPSLRMCNDASHLVATVAAVGEDALDKGEEPARSAQHLVGTIAILDGGGMYRDAQGSFMP